MISPGNHLYTGPDGKWRSAGPDDRFCAVNGPSRILEQLQQLLHTGEVAALDDNPAMAAALEGLRTRGIVEPTEHNPGSTRFARLDATVLLDGEGPVAERLAEILGAHATLREGALRDESIAEADLVVSCSGWLPDARWQDLARRCARHRTPWHMTYFEGDAAIIGPIFLPDRTANYSDVRGRRLGASAAPDELLALWAYLDGPQPKPPVPWPNSAWTWVIAGVLAADVLSALGNVTCPTAGHQLAIVPARAEFRRHRVLALPRLAAPVRSVRQPASG